VLTDIGADAVKIGMLTNAAVVKAVVEGIRAFGVSTLVVDPVMVAKSGDALLADDARKAIHDDLLPLATVITPNLYEAEALLGREIRSLETMREAARALRGIGCRWVVLKGGSLDIDGRAVDVVLTAAGWDTLRAAAPRHAARVRTLFFSDIDSRQEAQLADILASVYESILREGTLPRPD